MSAGKTPVSREQLVEIFTKLGISPQNIQVVDLSKNDAKEVESRQQKQATITIADIEEEILRLQNWKAKLQKEAQQEVFVYVWIGPYSTILRIKEKDKFYVLTKSGLMEADAPVNKPLEMHKFKNLDSALDFVRKF